MFNVLVKNTFLTAVDHDREVSHSAAARSRSKPCESTCSSSIYNAPKALAAVMQQQIEKLNCLLDLDLQGTLATVSATSLPPATTSESQFSLKAQRDVPILLELKELQRKLEQACHSQPQFPLPSAESSGSISSMVPSEAPTLHRPLSDLKKASESVRGLSNTSLSTMCPDDDAEDIDLDVEEPQQQPEQADHQQLKQPLKGPQQHYLHKCVPRHVDLAHKYTSASHTRPPTTMMIRNIPNRYTQADLVAELESMGFVDTFDFLYLPVDKGTMGSVGYAFVNFVDPIWATACMQQLAGRRFRGNRRNSGKPAVVSVAHLQGFEANMRHYGRVAVTSTEERKFRPMVKASLSQMIF